MKFYDITFFVDKDQKMVCHMGGGSYGWKYTMRFNQTSDYQYSNPQAIFFFHDEAQMKEFVDSVNKEYAKLTKHLEAQDGTTKTNKEDSNAASDTRTTVD